MDCMELAGIGGFLAIDKNFPESGNGGSRILLNKAESRIKNSFRVTAYVCATLS